MQQRCVVKRNGRRQKLNFEKIHKRLDRLSYGLSQNIDVSLVSQKVIAGVCDNITTTQLDDLAAEAAFFLGTQHPDYATLAARIAISNLHKNTEKSFSKLATMLYEYHLPEQETAPDTDDEEEFSSSSGDDEKTEPISKKRKAEKPKIGSKRHAPLLSKTVYDFIQAHADELDAAIDYDRDFLLDFMGFKVLCRSMLLQLDNAIAERPASMWMRVACGIWCGDVAKVIETYNLMSLKKFTHASPTLYNAATPNHQLSSCFLLSTKDDSIDGIYETLWLMAKISRLAGGIGLDSSQIRGKGAYIRGTNGRGSGLVPYLRVHNSSIRYVDQSGRRKGAMADYMTPFHKDFKAWIALIRKDGNDEQRCRDMHLALWIPNLFMECVEQDKEWCFFCPNKVRKLFNCHGKRFRKLYRGYSKRSGLVEERMPARAVFKMIVQSQIETGEPFMLYADACNDMSNHKHLGYLRMSNLCTEIIEYTDPDECAVCNLASIAVNEFVTLAPGSTQKVFDFESFHAVSKIVLRNLNRVIDVTRYPMVEAERSNLRHRPVGFGWQGLADLFILLRLPFESTEAAALNLEMAETFYHACAEASWELAQEIDPATGLRVGPYSSFHGSPLSKGQFQFDLYGVKPVSGRYDWDALRAKIVEGGVRNSLWIAHMPTVSTSEVLGNTQMFDPMISNVFSRSTLAGDFPVFNKFLIRDLIARGLWTDSVRAQIVANDGSVQRIDEIPQDLKDLYKTIWEVDLAVQMDRVADRQAFTCQSQSFSWHMANPTVKSVTAAHFYAFKKKLKTGMYYLRRQASADAQQVSVSQEVMSKVKASKKRRKQEEDDQKQKDDHTVINRTKSQLGTFFLPGTNDSSEEEGDGANRILKKSKSAANPDPQVCNRLNREECTACSA